MMNPAPPCPLGCAAHVYPWQLEAHIAVIHPQHHVHMLEPLQICPHLGIHPILIGGPPANVGVLGTSATPMTVN